MLTVTVFSVNGYPVLAVLFTIEFCRDLTLRPILGQQAHTAVKLKPQIERVNYVIYLHFSPLQPIID